MDRLTLLKTMPYEEYLKTPEWQAMRLKILERDGNRCRNCNSGKSLNVHHRTYARRGHEDPNDLTTLCETCHEIFHKSVKREEIVQRTEYIPLTKEEIEQRKKESLQQWEDYLMGLLLLYPDLVSHVRVIASEEDFDGEDTKALYCILSSSNKEGDSIPDQLLPSVERMKKSIEGDDLEKGKHLIHRAIECVTRLKRAHLLRLNMELKHLLDDAYRAGNTDTMRQLMKQKSEVDHRLRVIDGASK